MAYYIRFAGVSHAGLCRKENQDHFVCAGQLMASQKALSMLVSGQQTAGKNAFFGVFDGMGGTRQGSKASGIAAEIAAKTPAEKDPIRQLQSCCIHANSRICQLAHPQEVSPPGTTAAMLIFAPRQIALCNIGDSKIFRISNQRIEQISQDHILYGPNGERYLTKNLGIPEKQFPLRPYFARGRYLTGDRYLICSDGLTDMLTEQEILQIVTHYFEKEAVSVLLKAALNRGGKDNISIVLCRIEKRKQKNE